MKQLLPPFIRRPLGRIRRRFLPPPAPTQLPILENPTLFRTHDHLQVDCWAISRFVTERLIPVVGQHPFPAHELMMMTAAVCHAKPDLICDWGTHVGKSARAFWEICHAFGIDSEIHSVDLPDEAEHVEHPGDRRGLLVRDIHDIHLHQGDGVSVAMTLLRRDPPRRQPLFFLDGDHGYETVLRELRTIVDAQPRSYMLVHDTFMQSHPEDFSIDPHLAIQTFLMESRQAWEVIHSGLGRPGMTLLVPGEGRQGD